MIVIIDRNPERIHDIQKAFASRSYCAVMQSAEQLRNMVLSQDIFSVIADVDTLESFENGWESLLILNRGDTRLVLLSDRYNSKEINDLLDIEEEFPFSHEYLLTLISYTCRRARKFTFSYLRKAAVSMISPLPRVI
jgi:hypothetical protein